jgi:hypothetical protein
LTGGVGTALYRAPEQERTEKIELPNPNTSDPKARKRSVRLYDAKADMFSLGVILFEMCHEPFTTGMERVKTLLALRGGQSIFPEAFSSRVPENMRNIILWLVHVDPAKRPSAAELQSSPLMPPRIQLDKTYLEEVMSTLTTPNSDTARRVVTTLFDRKESHGVLAEHEDRTYDFDIRGGIIRALKLDSTFHSPSPTTDGVGGKGSAASTNDVSAMKKAFSFSGPAESVTLSPPDVLEAIRHLIEKVFLSHGATHFEHSLMLPRSCLWMGKLSSPLSGLFIHTSDSSLARVDKRQQILAASEGGYRSSFNLTESKFQPVELMDRSGTILSLPTDLVTPYARYIARLGLTNVTRYHIGSVYRDAGEIQMSVGQFGTQKHPLQSLEAVYDIVREEESTPSRSSTTALSDWIPSTRQHQDSEKRAFVEMEVVATAFEIVTAIDPRGAMGHRILRIGDSRLGNAILDLCAVPHPRDATLQALSIICDEAAIAPTTRLSAKDLFANATALFKDIGLPDDAQRALKPFIKILATQAQPLEVITAINKVKSNGHSFYFCMIISLYIS